MKETALCIALAALCASSCLRPAEDRAERDLEVGKAQAAGVSVAVSDGLAVVRGLTRERLVLWASAPSFRFSVEHAGSAGESLAIEIQNAMPEGVLSVQGATLSEVASAEPVPTRKEYRLTLTGAPLAFAFSPPEAQTSGAFRFALLSDVQEAIVDVQDIYAKLNAQPGLSFLFGAGDLTERGTREELEQFQRELRTLRIPYYTTLGNHELGETPTLYHDYFGRGSFTFLYRGVQFTPIDSASATLDPVIYDRLDGWLEQGRDRVHIVSMHIAPIDPTGVRNGSFASRGEAAKLLSKLAQGRVDLTLYGHVHSFYSFENAGIPAFISGGGGAVPERFDNIGRHFMVFEVDAKAGLLSNQLVRVD